MKNILHHFEIFSGLHINYKKSKLFAIGMEESFIREVAELWGYEIGTFLVCYLGIPLGINPKKEEVWEPIIAKCCRKLAPFFCCSTCLSSSYVFYVYF